MELLAYKSFMPFFGPPCMWQDSVILVHCVVHVFTDNCRSRSWRCRVGLEEATTWQSRIGKQAEL